MGLESGVHQVIEEFQGRQISQVLMADISPVREPSGETFFGATVGIYLRASDGGAEGPHVVATVAGPSSLDTPFQDLERAVLELVLHLMKRILQETPESLHRILVQTGMAAKSSTEMPVSGSMDD
jgi:hypothetical protein